MEKKEGIKIEIRKNFIYIKKYIENIDTKCGCRNRSNIYEEHYICTNEVYLDMLNSEDKIIQNMIADILFNMNDVPILDNGNIKWKYII